MVLVVLDALLQQLDRLVVVGQLRQAVGLDRLQLPILPLRLGSMLHTDFTLLFDQNASRFGTIFDLLLIVLD